MRAAETKLNRFDLSRYRDNQTPNKELLRWVKLEYRFQSNSIRMTTPFVRAHMRIPSEIYYLETLTADKLWWTRRDHLVNSSILMAILLRYVYMVKHVGVSCTYPFRRLLILIIITRILFLSLLLIHRRSLTLPKAPFPYTAYHFQQRSLPAGANFNSERS